MLGGPGSRPAAVDALAARKLVDHARDVPFALFYLIDPQADEAQLAGACGVDDAEFAPKCIGLRETVAWPLRRAAESGKIQIVDDLAERVVEVVAAL